jgi:hypothetical protein
MDELTLALRQHSQAFRPAEDAFERVVKRGNRRQRTRRIASAGVALGLFALVDLGLLRGLSPTHSTVTPGGPATDPSPRVTRSHETVPGSGGHPTSITDRPSGSGSRVVREVGDQPVAPTGSLHPGQVAGTGAPGANVTDEDTPRPTFTQSPLEPTKTKGAANPANGERAAPVQKDNHRRCATLKTKHQRARCWAKRHNHERPPSVQIIDPTMPTVFPADPGPSVSDPSAVPGTTDPTATDPTVSDPGAAGPASSGLPDEGGTTPAPALDGDTPDGAVADGVVAAGTPDGGTAPAPDALPA